MSNDELSNGSGNTGLINHIYSVSVEPERLLELIDRWEKRVGIGTPTFAFNDSNISHAIFAGPVGQVITALDHIISAHDAQILDFLIDFRSAAFILRPSGLIVAANPAALAVFNIMPGHTLADLTLHQSELTKINDAVEALCNAAEKSETILRLHMKSKKHATIAHLRAVDVNDGDRHVIVVTSEFEWHDSHNAVLKSVYGVTSSEVIVLQSLVRGETVRDIAIATKRTEGTIRSQVHSLLQKTQSESQAELIRLAITLLQTTSKSAALFARLSLEEKPESNVFQSLQLPDGRKYHYLEIGNPKGRPFILFPSSFARWPRSAELQMEAENIRMIVPIRAGYGPSSACPSHLNIYDTGADDIAFLMKALGIESCPALAICDDFNLAVHTANRHPGLFTALIGVSATMPNEMSEHFASMNKFTRFIHVNARHAPKALPYITLMFFHLARRIGRKKFFEMMFASSPVDLAALQDQQYLDALHKSADLIMTEHFMAHMSWTRETVECAKKWSDLFMNCSTPLSLISGTEDPFAPIETTRDYAQKRAGTVFQEIPQAGQLLVYTHYDAVLKILKQHFS